MKSVNETSIDQMSSEQRFQILVNGVTDYAIYMLSPTGEITNWNAGAERIKGYAAEEVVGTHFSRFYTEEDRAAELPLRTLEIAAEEGRYEQEGWRVRKDGSRFWANVVVDAVRDPQGRLIGFAKITRDMTKQVEAARALERARERLMQAQKMEAVGQLTGGVAHDFNNLLTVIVNCMDLLSEKLHEPDERRLLENAQHAAERGARLTQQLLAFSRRQALRPDNFDLNKLIRRFEPILRRACSESITFSLELAPALNIVHLDAEQFETALLNLVVNARDALPNGGRIAIATENVDTAGGDASGLPAGEFVKVSVGDNGHGMPPEVLQHAIEPFYTTKEVGKGTGLGLSQVYGFAVQSGGTALLESTVGEGTVVSMLFPASPGVSDSDVSSGAQTGGLAADAESDLAVRKALIVEDEANVLEVVVEIFRGLNFEVLTAMNGLDAIDILKHTRDIDMLFTDVVMPKGMSGVDLARFAQKLCPGLKILLASGYPQPMLTDDYSAFKEFAFISKPFRRAQLIEKIRSLYA